MQQREHGNVMSKQVSVDGECYTMNTIMHVIDNARFECVAIRQYSNGDFGLLHLSGDSRFIATRIYKHGNVVFNFNGVDAVKLYTTLCNVDDGFMMFDGELEKIGE